MGYRSSFHAYTPLPRPICAVITQVDVANFFAERNCAFENDPPAYHFAYCARARAWHVAIHTFCTQWRSPERSDAHPHHYQR